MYRTYVLHNIDINDIAATEKWYVMKHGSEIARRYGPWLERAESYRPVEVPEDAKSYAVTNYLCTECIWRTMPDASDNGFMGMTNPPKHARPFSCIVPVQPDQDFKGKWDAPDDHPILRWVQLIEYPEGVDKKAADDWYCGAFAAEAVKHGSLNRFFSFCRVSGDVHVAGHWASAGGDTNAKGGPKDHSWDRVTEMWFDDFEGWRSFVNSALPAPDWAQTDSFPFLERHSGFVSAFLLEFPAYDWKRDCRVFV